MVQVFAHGKRQKPGLAREGGGEERQGRGECQREHENPLDTRAKMARFLSAQYL